MPSGGWYSSMMVMSTTSGLSFFSEGFVVTTDTGTDRLTPAALAVSLVFPVLTPVTLSFFTFTRPLPVFHSQSFSVIFAPLRLMITTAGAFSLVPTCTVRFFSAACTLYAALFSTFSDTLTLAVFIFLPSEPLEPPQPNSCTQYMTLPTCTAPTPTRVKRLFSITRRCPCPAYFSFSSAKALKTDFTVPNP